MTQVFVCPDRKEIGRLRGVVAAFPEVWGDSVLDIGCRQKALQIALAPRTSKYTGVDLQPPADVVGDVEQGLGFASQTFDTVAALDVLEHTDRIHRAMAEVLRLAREYAVISLPNMMQLEIRLRVLWGRPISGKYGLPLQDTPNRHHWIFSFEDARRFCHHMASQHGFDLIREGALVGHRRGRILTHQLIGGFPNLLSPTYVCALRRLRG